MSTHTRRSEQIDAVNDEFTGRVKATLLSRLPHLETEALAWLVREHYQFSLTNVELLGIARDSTAKLANQGVTAEIKRNIGEENGHAPMYRRGMLDVGVDVDDRDEFAPTTIFLTQVRTLAGSNPSRALGAIYATETAAIFEHQVFYEICREICERCEIPYQGSLIKRFHDLHLDEDEGVEQGHKDGLAVFVDVVEPASVGAGVELDSGEVENGAYAAIAAMGAWWDDLLAELERKSLV